MPNSPALDFRLGRQQMFFLVAQSAFRAGLTPKLEKVLHAVRSKLDLDAEEAERIAREARASIEGKEPRRFSKSRIMNAALHLAKVDGEIDDREVQLLLTVGAIFGMPEPKVRAVIRSRLAGDYGLMLSTTEANLEEIEAVARAEAERMAMEAATTGRQPEVRLEPAPQPREDEVDTPESKPPHPVEPAPEAELAPPPEPAPEAHLDPPSKPRADSKPSRPPLSPRAMAGIGGGVLVLCLGVYLAWSLYAARAAQQQAELLETSIRDAAKEIMGHCRRGLDLAHEGKIAGGRAEVDSAEDALVRSLDAIGAQHRDQGKKPPDNLLAFPAAQIPAFRALVASQELEQNPQRFQSLDERIPQVEKIVAWLDDSVAKLRALRRLDPEADAEFEKVAQMHTQWSRALDELVMKRKNDRGF